MEFNQNILKSFLLQDELNPAIWILSEKGDETIRTTFRNCLPIHRIFRCPLIC